VVEVSRIGTDRNGETVQEIGVLGIVLRIEVAGTGRFFEPGMEREDGDRKESHEPTPHYQIFLRTM
jgi:hypothetical protein